MPHRKDLGYSLKRITDLLRYLLTSDQGLSYMELTRLMRTDFKTVQRYVQALEENGWVVMEPTETKNIVMLTERGKCIAQCLVTR